ncbi:MAG: T9SS type A sorting domain-containing protein [Paludibacter sp.]|nr:T9SS type A sorting domain-containing protein [Paludibacter sp.]
MRKLFTICACALLSLTYTVKAQVLATFEDTGTDQLELGSKWYESALFSVEPCIGDNPSKSGLNTSDKCFLAVNVADADWWGNFGELTFKTPVTITEDNRYLKFLVYRSIQPKDFRICVNENGNQEHEDAYSVYQGLVSEDATWVGVVADLGANWMGKTLTDITFIFSCNWTDPRSGWGVGTYAFDDFQLSSDPIPTGVTVIDPTGFNLNFENQTAIDEWVGEFDTLNVNNTYQIIDNPFTTSEVNSQGKVVEFYKSDQASWWQGFRTVFNGTMELNDNTRYLHAMVYVPSVALEDRMGVDVQLCAKDHTGAENNYLETVWDDQVDEWLDIVMELNSIDYLKELTVRFDVKTDETSGEYVNSSSNTYYLDEITLNDSPDPRFEITSGTKVTKSDGVHVYSKSGMIYVSDISSTNSIVNVYNTLGDLVHSSTFHNSATIAASPGLYIVSVSSNGDRKINKVLVK